MAYSANEINFVDKNISRVKYDLEYNSETGLFRFISKPVEVIKITDFVATNIFFDSTNDYEPVWFDSLSLEYIYPYKIFFDVANSMNLLILKSDVSSLCLDKIKTLIKYPIYWIFEDGIWDNYGIWMNDKNWTF